MKDMWNERFAKEEYAYGKEPNQFFKQQIEKLKPGRLLLLGEGEGRNGVYAAKLGWQVDAVDWSKEGKRKTEKLAEEKNVNINYTVEDLTNYNPAESFYDAVGLIFLHVEPELRKELHKKTASCLKTNGKIILESYEKDQLGNSSGGPKAPKLLHSLEEIFEDFQDLDIELFSKEEINLNESSLHNGPAIVIRYIGIKSS